jgi:hypothetical protein
MPRTSQAGGASSVTARGMSERIGVFSQVEHQMVFERKMVKIMNPEPPVLRTDDLRLLQRLVRAYEQAQLPKSRKQRNAQRVARKLAALRRVAV